MSAFTPGPWTVGEVGVYWRDGISIMGNGPYGGAVASTTVSRRAVLRAADTAQEAHAQIVEHVNKQDAAISGALNQVKALKLSQEALDARTATFMGRLNWLMFGLRP